MDGYRDANEAQQLRITTLEAQLKEKTAAVDARQAEVLELERRLKRIERERQQPKWQIVALGAGLVTALTGGSFMAYHLYEAQDRASALEREHQLAEETRLAERERHRKAEQMAEVARREAEEAQRRVHFEDGPRDAADDGNQGTLVAIAIGGSCVFAVDGKPRGNKSSIRIQVPIGPHTVTCTPAGSPPHTQRVDVAAGKPGIASFRL